MKFDYHIFVVLAIALGVIVADFLVGVIRSLIPPVTFSLQKFPGQLQSAVLPFFIPLVGLAVADFAAPLLNVAGVTGGTTGTFYVAASATILKFAADLLSKLTNFNAPAAKAALLSRPHG